jgi:hypothetical protein
MGILTRAAKNLSRRKTRALIIIIALTLALTMLIILPPSINAREAMTRYAFNGLISTDSNLNATVTMSATEIQCDYPPFFNSSMIGSSDTSNIYTQLFMNDSLYY